MWRVIGDAVSHFFENKKPRWPRIIFPALAFLFVALKEGFFDTSLIFSGVLPSYVVISAIASSSLLIGGVFYLIYFVTLHKLVRYATYHVFGLETYDLTLETLQAEHLISGPISPFKIQALLGSFFLEHPNARKSETVLMSSIFHGLYMTSIIGFVYFCVKFILEPGLIYSFSVLACFVVILFVMWCDSTFGENAEALCIRRHMDEFVDHLRSYLVARVSHERAAG